jgi:hypothetical protein
MKPTIPCEKHGVANIAAKIAWIKSKPAIFTNLNINCDSVA